MPHSASNWGMHCLSITLLVVSHLKWVKEENQGPVVQSIVRLTSMLMTNLLTVVAKVVSNTMIFLLLKCE